MLFCARTAFRGELNRVFMVTLKKMSVKPILPAVCTLLFAALSCAQALAVACTTQAEMKDADRAALANAARELATHMAAGDADGVKAKTIPAVAGNFDGIASDVRGLGPLLNGAALRVSSVYALDASNATPGQDEVEFFCGQAANAAHVSMAIPQLPPGRFAFVVVEATGVKDPQRLSMLLENVGGAPTAGASSASWQLAGFFPKPLLTGGHDGVWYWQKARDLHKAGANFSSYFYYETAQYLLLPADFVSSSNLDKLGQEATAVTPPGLPGVQPMDVQAGGQTLKVTNLHTVPSLSDPKAGLDLVINYDAASVSDPVATRTTTVALMKAMLTAHPDLKDNFRGLWLYANAPNQQPFSLELPVAQIESQQ